MNALITAMMIWIGAQTGLAVPATPPNVIIAPTMEALRVRAHPSLPPQPFGVGALYTSRTMRIDLMPGFDIEDPDYRALLVHELTHYMQHRAGLFRATCRGDLEKQAEAMQRAWTVREGRDPSRVPVLSDRYPCTQAVTSLAPLP